MLKQDLQRGLDEADTTVIVTDVLRDLLGVGVAVFQGKEAGFDPLVWAVDVGAKVFVLVVLALRRSEYF